MLQRISERSGLSRKYTNHCVRATTVTLLKERGIEDRKVCLVTGHKAERSLQHYDKPGNAKCNDLAKLLDGKNPKAAVAVALPKESKRKERLFKKRVRRRLHPARARSYNQQLDYQLSSGPEEKVQLVAT